MRLSSHDAACRRVTQELRLRVLDYFQLPLISGNLAVALDECGYWQADLVLCLLRINTREARLLVSRLVGHPIVVCPPCLSRRFAKAPPRRLARHEMKVTWTAEPSKLTAQPRGLGDRLRHLRPGMTLAQYRARGGRRRDLRVALARGLIRVEKAA